MLTTIEMMNSIATLARTRRNHRSCGVNTLQRISDQYAVAYGPLNRFRIM